jgi:hypothetical protein
MWVQIPLCRTDVAHRLTVGLPHRFESPNSNGGHYEVISCAVPDTGGLITQGWQRLILTSLKSATASVFLRMRITRARPDAALIR